MKVEERVRDADVVQNHATQQLRFQHLNNYVQLVGHRSSSGTRRYLFVYTVLPATDIEQKTRFSFKRRLNAHVCIGDALHQPDYESC